MTHPGELLKKNSLYAGKELGQNFLSNPATAQMIVDRTGVDKEMIVLEIGPGLGAITLPLARACKQVVAVEKDRRIIPLLEEELANEGIRNVTIINQDILKTDIRELAGTKKLVVIGNLPYNISSQILFQLITIRQVVTRAFLMFQKELAERLLSPAGNRNYSRLAAVVQYASKIERVADIRPNNFFPRPDVNSTVLRFDFFETKGMGKEDEILLFSVIKAAFSKRRKTLHNAMADGELGLTKEIVGIALENAGIDPSRRAETLNVQEFIDLSKAVGKVSTNES
ncbi:ribosomal RNA small subunit methyltransferase A [Desulfobacter hydrogenophilus]|uniref:Ribosomal RNA small subunit methyltransferase A n=1 Tax=Desulfobacter hydrogenophilus TaxID=2291 RepID=A0A328FF38_9BACT|nr:16S rRNA (adenine(1518)-N(6)/adenine(1519)-N(6))-dimethyltransferase RsmA [Desulfobacter hydrogenophilus]NDY72740.1 ribosomal RNA small subunit methyltransferase A [Desulfobacter hydrogenophilus]QBH12577.1 ribosomal RNA small subunit methyltransferase A [Desulfobacter hydrogenophilus]RAM03311.1 ribosomal RNA small subunit methyltransferase A [Desulfobacter hydrogenophilus]